MAIFKRKQDALSKDSDGVVNWGHFSSPTYNMFQNENGCTYIQVTKYSKVSES